MERDERTRVLGDSVAVGWLVNAPQYGQASVRYRCAHPVAQLQLRGLNNTIWSDSRRLAESLPALDAVVIVKRLEPDIVPLVARAAELGKKVFIDICDDIVAPDGRSQQTLLPQAVLRAVAPLCAALLCPSAAMQARLGAYLAENGLHGTPVVVLPDCVETDEVYRVSEAVWSRLVQSSAGVVSVVGQDGAVPALDPAQVHLVWFGNWGGPHSDFGLGSLLPTIHRLNGYAHRHEVVLHLVSNSPPLGDLLRARSKFAVVYHEWDRARLSNLLGQAHFALLTTGDDQFSTVKSNNRVLLALGAGVPVIVDAEGASSLWCDPADVPDAARIVDILEQARREGYAAVRQRMLDSARPALQPFRIERVGDRYVALLTGAASSATAPATALRRVAHVFGDDEDVDLAMQIREVCLSRGIEFVAIAGLRELTARKSLFGSLAKHGIKPSIVTDDDAPASETRRLRGADLVVMASSADRALGKQVHDWCRERGNVPVISQGAFLYRFRQR